MAKDKPNKCSHNNRIVTLNGCAVCVAEILRARKIISGAEAVYGMTYEDCVAAISNRGEELLKQREAAEQEAG